MKQNADNRPIRILHIIDNLGRGGFQNVIRILMDRLDPARFEHTVCAVRRVEFANSDEFFRGRARIMCLNWQDVGSRLQLPALMRVIRQVRPTIVHSRNWAGIEAVLAGRLAGSCALIHSEHGVNTDTVLREPWRRNAFRRITFQLADRVMCVSHQLKRLYAARTGFPEGRITVIHNGVDSTRFAPDAEARARMRRELQVQPGEFVIGCVGNLTTVKDYPTVLKAMEELSQRGLDWRLFVVGEGPQQGQVEGILQAHPHWKHRVTLLGARDGIPEFLQAIDVYLLSSITEGISNALLEAMATGLPVVATNTGGNPEVVVDGESGLLFPVGDSQRLAEHLVRLCAQPELRHDLGTGALRRAQTNFALEPMVRNYEQLYEGVLAPRHRVLAAAHPASRRSRT